MIFGHDVHDDVRNALAADSNYEHPNHVGDGYWFHYEDDNGVSHGSVYGRVVGVEDENDPRMTVYTLLVEGVNHVATVPAREAHESKGDSEAAYGDWENDW